MKHTHGGYNKTHGQVEAVPRVDSFELADCSTFSHVFCGRKLVEIFKDWDEVDIHPPGGGVQTLRYTQKPNGYGGAQFFYFCPVCGGRHRFLYFTGYDFRCRKCARLNYLSQQQTKGDKYDCRAARKMLENNFRYTPFEMPEGLLDYIDEKPRRPPGMHNTTYKRLLTRYTKYQERAFDRFVKTFAWLAALVG